MTAAQEPHRRTRRAVGHRLAGRRVAPGVYEVLGVAGAIALPAALIVVLGAIADGALDAADRAGAGGAATLAVALAVVGVVLPALTLARAFRPLEWSAAKYARETVAWQGIIATPGIAVVAFSIRYNATADGVPDALRTGATVSAVAGCLAAIGAHGLGGYRSAIIDRDDVRLVSAFGRTHRAGRAQQVRVLRYPPPPRTGPRLEDPGRPTLELSLRSVDARTARRLVVMRAADAFRVDPRDAGRGSIVLRLAGDPTAALADAQSLGATRLPDGRGPLARR